MNKKCFDKFISFMRRWNSFQKTWNFAYLFTWVNRMNAFIVVCILLKSTYTRFRFSKISFTIKYLDEKFLFNRAKICLYVSSSSLMFTYVIVVRSIEYQSTFAFSLFCIVDSQCSNFALSSIKIVEFEMTIDRFVFSSRSNALMLAIISWFAVDDLNDDVMNYRTLRVRFWVVKNLQFFFQDTNSIFIVNLIVLKKSNSLL
jgi:hypothetical protein